MTYKPEVLAEGEWDEFLEMAFRYDPNKDYRWLVFCEECDDTTIVSTKTGVACGHRPKWLDDMRTYAK